MEKREQTPRDNLEDNKGTKTTEWIQQGMGETPKEREERTGSHWLTMDPRAEMAFFTSSTFPAENLNTGETEACLGN